MVASSMSILWQWVQKPPLNEELNPPKNEYLNSNRSWKDKRDFLWPIKEANITSDIKQENMPACLAAKIAKQKKTGSIDQEWFFCIGSLLMLILIIYRIIIASPICVYFV